MKTYKLTLAAAAALAFATPAVAEDTTTTAAPAATPTAQEQCRAERDGTATQPGMGKALFAQTYGTNKNKSNAFGKCVSKREAKTDEAKTEARTNAAKECKAEETADPVAFKAAYGTGKNGANAYGKCVSKKAKAKTNEAVAEQVAADVKAAKSCKTERKADPVAFKAKYGGKANAFGKCVSTQAKARNDDKPAETTTS